MTAAQPARDTVGAMTHRARALLASSVAAAIALSGCSLPGDSPSPSDGAADSSASGGASGGAAGGASRTAPTGSEPLSEYYAQELSWQRCDSGQCADLTVPLSYDDPDGETIAVKVLRMPATRKKSRIGSLVVNPGGPGGSGVDYARAADYIVGEPVRQRFDIVGFDPRGVQRSAPIDCLPDEGMDAFLGQDPTPDDAAEVSTLAAAGKKLGQGCQARTGELIGNVSTVDAARDMDILRSALGEAQLHYLGKSYGTFLGATYAGLFPQQVGRFVLDGVLPPDATPVEIAIGQAEGFERATRAWARSCVDKGGCPLGSSVEDVMSGLRALLERLDRQPVTMNDARLSRLTEGWAALGIAQAMYDQGSWPALTDALRQIVESQNGTELMQLADEYARRDANGRYAANLLEAFYAISCLDNPDTADPAAYEQRVAQASAKAPTWGPFLVWSSMVCGQWPVTSGSGPQKIAAEGSGPIVVVGTTRDPATPYEWSVRLSDQLANARLLTFDGDGHTAYARSNDCVDDAINDYYTKAEVPRDGLKC